MRIPMNVLVASISVLVITGCSSIAPPPEGWLAKGDATQTDVYGGWTEVASKLLRTDPILQPQIFKGELIAIQNDSVFIHDGATFHGVPFEQIAGIRVRAYAVNLQLAEMLNGLNMGMALLSGVLMEVASSKGGFGGSGAVFIPLFALQAFLFGTTSLMRTAALADYDASRNDPESIIALKNYARFPQGMPAALDRTKIKPKPFQPPPKPVHNEKTNSATPEAQPE